MSIQARVLVSSALALFGLTTAASAQLAYHRTFFGGNSYDRVQGVTVDAQNHAYVTGHTASTNLDSVLPATNGYDTTSNGNLDALVAVFDSDLQHVLHWTLIGGSNQERGYSVRLASNGDVIVVGFTESPDFPTTGGAPYHGGFDVFIARFSPDLQTLRSSVLLGGSGDENSRGSFCLDASDNVYVGGETQSFDFPATPGAFQTSHAPANGGDNRDGFLAKITTSGQVIWATYIGGSRNDASYSGVRLAPDGTVYTAGMTNSADFPVTPNAYQHTFGGNTDPNEIYIGDAFVARFTSDGSALVFSTFIGGSEADGVSGNDAFELDPAGNPVIIGQTKSPDFPVTPQAFDTTFHGAVNQEFDGFVAKLSADGQHLLAATFIGGEQFEEPSGLALDASGDVYLSGTTESANFPVTPDADQATYGGGGDGFLARLSADFQYLTYASYIGGSGTSGYGDRGRGLTLTPSGQVLVGGDTDSTNLPMSSYAFDSTFSGGSGDGFVSIEPVSATYTFGVGKLNSIGLRPILRPAGAPSAAIGSMKIKVGDAVPLRHGVFAYGPSLTSVPFLGGTMYMSKPIVRCPPTVVISAAGLAHMTVPITPDMIGQTRVYQFWYRDPAVADGTDTGLSGALKVTFTP
jgi:hypothetical protein